MKTALAFLAVLAITSNAALTPRKMQLLEKRGVDIPRLLQSAEEHNSRAALSVHKARLSSEKRLGAHKARQAKVQAYKAARLEQGSDFSNQIDEEEAAILDFLCEGNKEENCTEEKIDKVAYAFAILKGIVVGVTALYS